MLKSVSESARRHSQALDYVPGEGMLLAGGNAEYRLGTLFAEGGEGKIFTIQSHEGLVAKIYKELDLAREDKLRLMVSRTNRGLRKVCAWPLSPLYDAQDEAVGFVMESLVGWQPLHNAYQIRSRLKLFPHQTYAFLVRAARNLATCVHHLHEQGLVVGDLNESNVFVNAKAMVKLVDADSFQIAGPTAVYPCKVAKPELMPPELQGHSLQGIVRTPVHDRFALAALIFQTLVFGRHPFAGQTDRHTEIPLESAIEKGYYAYTAWRPSPVKPPPYLTLEWLPKSLRDLFEQAFDPISPSRPTAKDWYFALKELESTLKLCPDNPSHLYWSGAKHCAWCELEDQWKIALFRPALTDPDQEYELDEILARIDAIPAPATPDGTLVAFDYTALDPARLNGIQVFFGRVSKNWGWFIFCFFQIINILSPPNRGFFTAVLVFSLAVIVVFGSLVSRSEMLVKKAKKKLARISETWRQEADEAVYSRTLEAYRTAAAELKDVKTRFERGRQAFIEEFHAVELQQYLAKYSVLVADAGPLGSEKLSYLYDNGVRTAADVDDERFRTLPRIIQNDHKLALMNWRRSLEDKFWRSHNYKLTIHQERNLIVQIRKENDRKRQDLDEAPQKLEELADRLRVRQQELLQEAEKHVQVLRLHGPKLLALEGKKAS